MTETESPKRMGRFWSSFDERVDANSVGTLALRVIIGTIFFMNETAVLGWFGGQGGLAGEKEFVAILGYEPATPLTWLLVLTGIATGVCLILGFATPLASAGAIGISFNVIFHAAWKQGFLGGEAGPGYVLSAVLAVGALALALIGPGRYSVDRALGWSLRGNRWGALALALGVGVGTVVLTVFGPGFGGFSFSPSPAAAIGGDLPTWCLLVDDVREAVGTGLQLPAETFDEFAASAPDEIRPATQTAASAFKESVATAFEKPEVEEAVGAIEAYAASNCGAP